MAAAVLPSISAADANPRSSCCAAADGQSIKEYAIKSRSLQSSRNGITQCLQSGAWEHRLLGEGIGSQIERSRLHAAGHGHVHAKLRKSSRKMPDKEYPWPVKFKPEDLLGSPLPFLSRFKPLTNKRKPVSLPFELPLADMQKKIQEQICESANTTGMDYSVQLSELQEKYDEVRKDLYSQLSPVQRLSVARHPHRPTCLDHVHNITDKWLELHGDRAGYDDPALITGIGKMDGMSFMFVGHQKGRNTKENIYRNFAMPTPNGYRKALRMMQYAERHGFPILTFVDTPGAYAGIQAEERGQGEAIAKNLREMFGLKVPIITTVIGEGGSGGALAIGCCDKMLMLENSVYYVASPEACASILWKTAAAAPKATEALKITAHELVKLDVVDEVIPEPVGGAHADPLLASMNIKEAILRHMHDLLNLQPEALLTHRVGKFRKIGSVQEGVKLDPHIKRNMKPREAPLETDVQPMQLPSFVHRSLGLSLQTASAKAE